MKRKAILKRYDLEKITFFIKNDLIKYLKSTWTSKTENFAILVQQMFTFKGTIGNDFWVTIWLGPSTQDRYSPRVAVGPSPPSPLHPQLSRVRAPSLWFSCTGTSVNTPLYTSSPLMALIWLSHLFPVRTVNYTITLHSQAVQKSSTSCHALCFEYYLWFSLQLW